MVARKKTKGSGSVSKVIVTLVMIVAVLSAFISIEEVMSLEGDYRVTLWDRMNGRGDVPKGRSQVSQQVAVQICRQQSLSLFGRNLLSTRFDQRSSRYTQDLKVHSIYLDLVIKDREREEIFIRCDVSAVNRDVLKYRINDTVGFMNF